MKEVYKETHVIDSIYYNKDDKLKIIVASDIHYHKNVNKDLYLELVECCKKSKPNFIVLPGDMIETIGFIDNDNERTFFEGVLQKLSNIAPVIMTPGNHEKANFNLKLSRDLTDKGITYFESLNKFKNVYFLNNKIIKIDGITFIGFNPRLETYLSKDKKKISKIFIEDYNKCNFKINEKDYNVLITHSPIAIAYRMEDIDELNNIDLVITGHLHNGHLPKKMKSLDNKKTGIFFVPFALPFPGMICRGLHKFKRGYLLISKGFRNLTADVLLFNLIEKISVNEIEEVIVQNCKRSKGKIVKN